MHNNDDKSLVIKQNNTLVKATNAIKITGKLLSSQHNQDMLLDELKAVNDYLKQNPDYKLLIDEPISEKELQEITKIMKKYKMHSQENSTQNIEKLPKISSYRELSNFLSKNPQYKLTKVIPPSEEFYKELDKKYGV